MTSIKNMFGIDPPTKEEPIGAAEINRFFVDLLRNVYASETLGYYDSPFASSDIARAMTFLGRREDLYERRLDLVRFLIAQPGDLLDFRAPEEKEDASNRAPSASDRLQFAKKLLVTDNEVRALLRNIAARLEALLGEEPLSIPPRGPFR